MDNYLKVITSFTCIIQITDFIYNVIEYKNQRIRNN